MQVWTKQAAASEQIDGAIECFANGRYICARTLLGAASGIVMDVAKARGQPVNELLWNEFLRQHMPEHHSEVRRHLREPQNFAKHADRDSEAEVKVHPTSTALLLCQAVVDYSVLFRHQTPAHIFFRTWVAARHPDLFPNNSAYVEKALEMFPGASSDNLEASLGGLREKLTFCDREMTDLLEETMLVTEIDWSAGLGGWPEHLRPKAV